jgi:hypothetical protein
VFRVHAPFNLAVSRDGERWPQLHALETKPGAFDYPSMVLTSDGALHITYTWRRQKVKHGVSVIGSPAPGDIASAARAAFVSIFYLMFNLRLLSIISCLTRLDKPGRSLTGAHNLAWLGSRRIPFKWL